ncbi:MAG TPA: hypothetical protein ENK66_05240 [Arcobacter sp.]|nr:hypothetical protein [Arcobacter sp.]
MQAQSQLEELIKFFENETLGISLDEFLTFESSKDFHGFSSDVTILEKALIDTGMHIKGFAKDQFIVLGEHGFTNPAKLKGTRIFGINSKYVSDTDAYSPQEITYAKNALYKNEYYEAGPFGRMLSQSVPLIKNMHRRYKDSAYSRVMARVFEIGYMLDYSKTLLTDLDIAEDSVIAVTDIKKISTVGVGVTEAPRGPLLHKIELKNGMITKYHITTPTQFNIGSSIPQKLTPVQQAMQGLNKEEALFIFRTFDVCSVCTTH